MTRSRRNPGAGQAAPPSVLLAEAEALWKHGRYDECLRVYDRTVAAAPSDGAILLGAARAYGIRSQRDKADRLLKRALARIPVEVDRAMALAETFDLWELPREAHGAFAEADRLGHPLAILRLAELSEKLGVAAEAEQAAGTLLERSGPEAGIGSLVLSRLSRRAGDLDSALRHATDAMHRLTNHPRHGESLGELAQVHDARDEPAEAMDAMRRAKAPVLEAREHERRAADHVNARMAALHRALKPDHLRRWAEEAPSSPGPRLALLAGFPRSGTTLLERILDAHDGLVAIEERMVLGGDVFLAMQPDASGHEPALDVLEGVSPGARRRLRKRYVSGLTSWAHKPVERNSVLLDKNPASTPLAPVLMRLDPDARIVYARRDPRDVVLSCYLTWMPLNPISVDYLSLERLAERYELVRTGWFRFREAMDLAGLGDRIVEIEYERLVEQPAMEAPRVVRTLGIDWNPGSLRPSGSERSINSPSYQRASGSIVRSRIGRWELYRDFLPEAVLRMTS